MSNPIETATQIKKEIEAIKQERRSHNEEIRFKGLTTSIETLKATTIAKREAWQDEVQFLERLGLVKIKETHDYLEEYNNDTFDEVIQRISSLKEGIKELEGI